MKTSGTLSGLKFVRHAAWLVGLMLGALFFALPTVNAEEAGRTFTLGTVNPGPPVPRFTQVETEALRDLGYTAGQNLHFIERWAQGSEEQLHRDAAELVKLKVDVILAGSSAGGRAAVSATRTIPIVAIDLESDPVANGWATSLSRPGGNVTGCFLDLPELTGKRLQQLMEVVPHLSKIAVLWDGSLNRAPLKATEAAAKVLGLRVIVLEVRRASELDRSMKTAANKRVQAVLM